MAINPYQPPPPIDHMILLYWNRNSNLWSTEDSGANRQGLHWFFIPTGLIQVAPDNFSEVRKFKLTKGKLSVYKDAGQTWVGETKEEIYYGTPYEAPMLPLQTEIITQMPFIDAPNLEESAVVRNWFYPVLPFNNPWTKRPKESGIA